ncbi:MAG TPA: hypothetical protein VI524_00115 [Anaerolineales bacterium]|nr:hypothetical protein [Anaerolineales bacterium]
MVQSSIDPYSTGKPRSSSAWWKWALGAIAACLFLGCAGTIGFILYFGQEPENLSIDYSMPSVVKKGEDFDLTITLANTGSTSLTVGDIDLDELMGGSILDGAIVLVTEPQMERDYSLSGIKTFHYNETLQPGETRTVIFHLQATTVGEFGGSVGVYVGNTSKRINYLGIIIQE